MTPTGLTRNQAIALLERVTEEHAPTRGHWKARERWIEGAREMLRALIDAGAFVDGRNWADRLPLQPGEREP